ncbi:hypothetical protein FRC11_012192 [Ceratobasidium sp. 423]|nr:hypothetical protein FRC11_012192 [Ceratobasidium sp. 423]
MGNQKNRSAARPAAARKSERLLRSQTGAKRTHSPPPENEGVASPDDTRDRTPAKRARQLLLTSFIHTNKPVGGTDSAIQSLQNPFQGEARSIQDTDNGLESEDDYDEEPATQGATRASKPRPAEDRAAGSQHPNRGSVTYQSDDESEPQESGAVMIPIDVETGTSIRGFDLSSTSPFAIFKYEVARILDCSLAELKLAYLTPDMKPLPGRKLCPRSVETHREFDTMVNNAIKFIQEQEIDISSDSDVSEKKSKKGKKKSRGRGRPPKAKTPIKYTITVINQTAGSDPKPRQTKEKGSSSKTSTSALGELNDEAILIGQADRNLFNTWKSLQEARYCKRCKKSCLIIRVKNQDGTVTLTHRPLAFEEQRVWAMKINDGEPGVSNHIPPAELKIGDPAFKDHNGTPLEPPTPAVEPVGNQQPINAPPPQPVPTPQPFHAGQFPPAGPTMYSGYPVPGPYPFPFPPPGPLGYPPNPYFGYYPNQPPLSHVSPPAPSPVPPAYPNPANPALSNPNLGPGMAGTGNGNSPIPVPPDFATPLLSEWLNRCSQGYRGHDGHDYVKFLPAFEDQAVVRVLDFYNLHINQIIKLVQRCDECDNYIHFGTAQRLHRYAQEDVQKAYNIATLQGRDNAWPGYTTVNASFQIDDPSPS